MKFHYVILCLAALFAVSQPMLSASNGADSVVIVKADSAAIVKADNAAIVKAGSAAIVKVDSVAVVKEKDNKRTINRFDTKLGKNVFIRKGNVMLGGLVGGTSIQGDNINFLILKNINNLQGYYLSIAPFIGGFVADNCAIGVRFRYNRLMANLGNLDLNLGEDMNISLKDLYTISHKYEGSFYLRNYIPFGKSKVVGMYVDTNLTYTRSQGKNTTGSGADLDGTFQQGQSIGLYVNPGLCVFVCNTVAAEFGIGILGIEYSGIQSITNQVETGSFVSKGANLRFNPLKIDLGISFYF